jgi:predicted DNA binding CopG/RHH family protein
MSPKKKRLKKLPVLKTDEEAERFVDTADLSDYDLSEMVPVRFEWRPKTERVNMRLSSELLQSVKARAAREGVSYQRYIRLTLEKAVASPERQAPKQRHA